MADLSRIATETMELIDHLEGEIEEGQEVGEVLLVVQLRDEDGAESLQYRCSNASYVVQRGLVSWANDAMAFDAQRIHEEDD